MVNAVCITNLFNCIVSLLCSRISRASSDPGILTVDSFARRTPQTIAHSILYTKSINEEWSSYRPLNPKDFMTHARMERYRILGEIVVIPVNNDSLIF